MMEERYDNWATASMKEYPFWRDDMQPKEFDQEREYYLKNFDLIKTGMYTPLWQQKKILLS
jgi:hypothetical protein